MNWLNNPANPGNPASPLHPLSPLNLINLGKKSPIAKGDRKNPGDGPAPMKASECEAMCQSNCQTNCQSMGQCGSRDMTPPGNGGGHGEARPTTTSRWAEKQQLQSLLIFVETGAGSCPLSCSYCFLPKTGKHRIMTVDVLHRAIDFLRENLVKEPGSLHFFGTEPLTRWHLIVEARRYAPEMNIAITTNGVLLNDRRIEWLAENDVRIYVYSIDGGPEHNRAREFRNGKESWPIVARNFRKLLLTQGQWITARATWTPDDYDLVGRFRALEELGASSIQVVPDVSREWDEDKVAQAYAELGDDYRHRMPPSKYIQDVIRGILHPRKPGDGCRTGYHAWAVSPDGELSLCQQFAGRLTIGDVWHGITNAGPFVITELAEIACERGIFRHECSGCIAYMHCPGVGWCAGMNMRATGHPAIPPVGYCQHLRGMVRGCQEWAYRQPTSGLVGKVLMEHVVGGMANETEKEAWDGDPKNRIASAG